MRSHLREILGRPARIADTVHDCFSDLQQEGVFVASLGCRFPRLKGSCCPEQRICHVVPFRYLQVRRCLSPCARIAHVTSAMVLRWSVSRQPRHPAVHTRTSPASSRSAPSRATRAFSRMVRPFSRFRRRHFASHAHTAPRFQMTVRASAGCETGVMWAWLADAQAHPVA